MARIENREQFRCYVLTKLGEPLLDLVLQKDALDECDTAGTTGTTGTSGTQSTGTTGTSGTQTTATTGTTGTSGVTDPRCQSFTKSLCTQLDLAIDDALDYFQNYASGLGNEKAVLYINLEEGKSYYDVPPCVMSIEQPLNKGATFAMDSEEAEEGVGLFSLQSQFGPRGVFSYLGAGTNDTLLTYEVARQYNQLVDLRYTIKFQTEFLELENKMLVFPTPSKKDNNKVMAMLCSIKTPDDKSFNHLWVQRYAVALTMEQIGRNLSMYSGMQLPGGGDFNSSFYWDMGRQDKDKLEEELISGKYGNEVAGGIMITG